MDHSFKFRLDGPLVVGQLTEAPRQSDTPRPGFYLLRLVRGGPWVGAEITRHPDGQFSVMCDGKTEGPSHNPWILPLMERVHFGGRETTESEVRFRVGARRWAEIYAPSSAPANPHKPIDLDSLIPF